MPSQGSGPAAIVDCRSEDEYLARLPEVVAQIEERGLVIVRGWDASEATLLAVAHPLGRPQRHAKADERGIAPVTPERDMAYDGTFDRNVSRLADAFTAHTDGSYLDGLCIDQGAVRRVMPPAMFLLQCVRPVRSGGMSFFIDGRELFLRLAREAPDLLDLATQPGLIDYCGGELVAMHHPLFSRRSSGRWRIRYRSDLMYVPEWARPRMQELIDRYIESDVLRTYHRLGPCEIVIGDNLRMLHGRDAIQSAADEEPRLLRRLWFWDEESDSHLPLGRTSPADDSIFELFREYGPLPWRPPADGALRPRLGIDASA